MSLGTILPKLDSITESNEFLSSSTPEVKGKSFLFEFFNDIYSSTYRSYLYSLMTIGLIVLFSPLYIFDINNFGLYDSIFFHTMNSDSVRISQFSMLSIMVPIALDTALDFQENVIQFDSRERILFMTLTFAHAITNIVHNGTLKGAVYYIFVNQACVIISNCATFSCYTRLKKVTPEFMISIFIGFTLVIIGSTIKMYGLVYEKIAMIGVVVSIIGNILQFINCFLCTCQVLNIIPCEYGIIGFIKNFTLKKVVKATLEEEVVAVYLSIFMAFMLSVFISNQVTGSILWKDSSEPNILSYQIFHIILVTVIVFVPMRLNRKRHTRAVESITLLSNQLETEHMILTQVLPKDAVENILAGMKVKSQNFESCTVFFSDIEGFTNLSSQVEPEDVMYMLDELYSIMDYVTAMFPPNQLLKIETIGDAYMLASGILDTSVDHVQCMVEYALIVCRLSSLVLNPVTKEPLRIRIGIHTGPVCAGIVGFLTPHWCLFGDTVNTAARTESIGSPGKINISESTANILIEQGIYNLTKRDKLEVKGKGLMQTYWLHNSEKKDFWLKNGLMNLKLLEDECQAIIDKCKASRIEIDLNDDLTSMN